MRAIFLTILLIFPLISCQSKDEKTQIRFVNLQGKPRNISMRYPEKNLEALNKKMPQESAPESLSFDESVNRSVSKMIGVQPAQKGLDNASKTQEIAYNNSAENSSIATEEQNQEVVEYDLGQKAPDLASNKKEEKIVIHEVEAPENNLPQSKNKSEKKQLLLAKNNKKDSEIEAKKSGKYFVQVGAFSNGSNAKSLLTKMKKFHSGAVKKIDSGEKVVYRVWLGPLKTKGEAENLAKKISTKNQAAIVVKDK